MNLLDCLQKSTTSVENATPTLCGHCERLWRPNDAETQGKVSCFIRSKLLHTRHWFQWLLWLTMSLNWLNTLNFLLMCPHLTIISSPTWNNTWMRNSIAVMMTPYLLLLICWHFFLRTGSKLHHQRDPSTANLLE